MTEQQSNLPEPDRYSVDFVKIDVEKGGTFEAALQRGSNEGSRQSEADRRSAQSRRRTRTVGLGPSELCLRVVLEQELSLARGMSIGLS
ncbi:hypothetical protein BH24ACT22_BH24ACT22_05260 [soil metagenome]